MKASQTEEYPHIEPANFLLSYRIKLHYKTNQAPSQCCIWGKGVYDVLTFQRVWGGNEAMQVPYSSSEHFSLNTYYFT